MRIELMGAKELRIMRIGGCEDSTEEDGINES